MDDWLVISVCFIMVLLAAYVYGKAYGKMNTEYYRRMYEVKEQQCDELMNELVDLKVELQKLRETNEKNS